MQKEILRLLRQPDYAPSNVPELLNLLGQKRSLQQKLQAALRALEQQGQIIRTKGNRYLLTQGADMVPGTISINRGGKGFVQPDVTGAQEIIVPESRVGTAMNGDRVLVRRDSRAPRGREQASGGESYGEVIRVLERRRSSLVGTLHQTRHFLYVTPDDPRLPRQILVPPAKDVGRPAHVGDKVVVEIAAWDSPREQPEGEIIEVLGPPDAEGVDMLSVLRQYSLPLHFPKNVLKEAADLAKTRHGGQPTAEDLVGRVDCREHDVITIDPDDAKDFDDAICLQQVSPDRWRLWVHIADVSHYVKPGTALDAEARKRGNSTYLVDRVVPMLPEALSNELCSLKPQVDRLTKCVEFTLSDQGNVVHAKFYSAVIRSKRRYTYQEAFQIIQRTPQGPLEQMLHAAHEMAQKIRQARFKHGSLALDNPETKIRLDDQGKVLRIEKVENDVSHQLIEEYMLLANEAVADRLMKMARPTIFRIHEPPKENRLRDFRDSLVGHNIPCGDLNERKEVQKMLSLLSTLPIGGALKIGFLRSMMRARYAIEPIGHYGLNKKKYAHFTSPIRRYADLVVHRSLYDKEAISVPELQEIAVRISGTEKNSSDAERDSKDVKMYAYLKQQIEQGKRESYSALIIEMLNFGFFVDVTDLGMSGLVHLSSMDDYFEFQPSRSQVQGRRTQKVYRVGDRIMVEVSMVDSVSKKVDFRVVKTEPAVEQERSRTRIPEKDFSVRQPKSDKNKRPTERVAPTKTPKKSSGKKSEEPFWLRYQKPDAATGESRFAKGQNTSSAKSSKSAKKSKVKKSKSNAKGKPAVGDVADREPSNTPKKKVRRKP